MGGILLPCCTFKSTLTVQQGLRIEKRFHTEFKPLQPDQMIKRLTANIRRVLSSQQSIQRQKPLEMKINKNSILFFQ